MCFLKYLLVLLFILLSINKPILSSELILVTSIRNKSNQTLQKFSPPTINHGNEKSSISSPIVLNKNKITIEKIPTYNLSNLNFSLGLHLRKNKLIASSKQKIFDNFYIQEFIESNRGLLNINVRGLKYFGENKIFRPYIGLETPVLKSFYSSEHELSGIMGFENKYCLLIIKAPIKFLESIFLTPKLGSTPDIDPFSEVLVSFSSPIQQILFYFSSMLINGSLAFLNQHPHSLSYIELRLKKNIELVSIKIEAGIEYSF